MGGPVTGWKNVNFTHFTRGLNYVTEERLRVLRIRVRVSIPPQELRLCPCDVGRSVPPTWEVVRPTSLCSREVVKWEHRRHLNEDGLHFKAKSV